MKDKAVTAKPNTRTQQEATREGSTTADVRKSLDADAPVVEEASTDGPGAVYYSRRQELRQSGKTSEEVNAIEAGLAKKGKLFEDTTTTKAK